MIVDETRPVNVYFGMDAQDSGIPAVDIVFNDGKRRLRVRPTGMLGAYMLIPIDDWHHLVDVVDATINDYAKVAVLP